MGLLTKRPAPSPTVADLGFVGCSNTQRAVGGYQQAGGHRLWAGVNGYQGGAVYDWATGSDTSEWWQEFDDFSQAFPPSAIWWELCMHDNPLERATPNEDALLVLARIRLRHPTIRVYVSAINGYPAGYKTSVAYVAARDLCVWLLAHCDVQPGPVMPDLELGMIKPDHIHPNAAGQKQQGAALLGWFG